jgi:hypothetical protein
MSDPNLHTTRLDGTMPGELDGTLDAALSTERDNILPSSGFTDQVMAAVLSEAPAPLGFPWKRALPGLIAGGTAIAGFGGAEVWLIAHAPAAAPSATALDWQAMLAPVLHLATTPDATGILLALLIPLASLWLTRRLLFSR